MNRWSEIANELDFLRNYDTLFLACSGGVDSMVLLHLLSQSGFPVTVLHCNFNLRGKDSDDDEKFITDHCRTSGISFACKSFDTKRLAGGEKSIQAIARELRYEWFDQLILENPNSIVCTAHHLDDNREEVLLKLMSSGKLSDLGGIMKQRPGYYRPLLSVSKQDIIRYATENTLSWREDASNKENKYTRNKVRNLLLPLMQEIDPRSLSSLDRLSQDVQRMLSESDRQWNHFPGERSEFFFADKDIRSLLFLQRERLLVQWMQSTVLATALEQLISSGAAGAIVEHGDFYIQRQKNGFWFGKHSLDTVQLKFSDLGIPDNTPAISVTLTEMVSTSSEELFIPQDLLKEFGVRNPLSGETIPFRGKNERPLKKILNDLKLSFTARKKALVLTRNNQPVLFLHPDEISTWNQKKSMESASKIVVTIFSSFFAEVKK